MRRLAAALSRMLLAILVCHCAIAGVIESPPLRVTFPEEHRELATESLTVLQASLAKFDDRLPAGDAPIHVFICGTHAEFARYAGSLSQSSVTGVAQPEAGIIAVKTPDIAGGGTDYKGTLRHELIHVLLARNSGSGNLPRWLNEGIAMMVSGEHRVGSSIRVGQMYVQGRLIPYRDLYFVFLEPGREMEFGDAYAQALSMTRFLMDRIGEDAFWRVVYATKTKTFGEALRAEASVSPTDFYDDWVGSLWMVALVFSLVSGFTAFQLMAILTIVAYLRKRRKGQATLREWEDEEDGDTGWDDAETELTPWDEEELRLEEENEEWR
jgi:hypothetical protein